MSSKIVLGSDGSETALQAARLAATLAKPMAAEIIAVNAFDLGTAVAFLSPDALDATELIVESGEAVQDTVLKRTAAVLNEAGVHFRTIADAGDAKDSLLRVADEEQARLIIVGDHQLRGVEDVLFGQIADGVLHHAKCPVLVAHGETTAIRRILVGVDGSELADNALRVAAEFALPLNAVIVALNVLDPDSPYPGIDPTETDQYGYALLVGKAVTERVEEILRETNVTHEVIQEAGKVVPTVLNVAATRDIDLIAIGSHSPGTLKRLLRGSHSFEILHHAPCPVLIVH